MKGNARGFIKNEKQLQIAHDSWSIILVFYL